MERERSGERTKLADQISPKGDMLYRNFVMLYKVYFTRRRGFPWDYLRKVLHGGQRMAKVHSGEEIFSKASTRAE